MKKTVFINVEKAREDTRAIFKYVDSDRSDGKTTAMIRMAYDEFKATGKAAVCMRRFVGALTKTYMMTICDNLRVVRPDCGKLTFSGSAKKEGISLAEDGKPFALFIPLSRADGVKGALDKKRIGNMYFDEYTPLDGRYLKDEVKLILSIWETIDRRTYTTTAWFFSNHLATSNPLLNFFHVVPQNGISRWQNGRFLMLRVANKGNREQMRMSPFGELVEGTGYEDYAFEGGALNPVKRFVTPKHDKTRLPFTIRCNGTYGLYMGEYGLVVDVAEPRAGEKVYTVEKNAGTQGGTHLSANADLLHYLRVRFLQSQITFANDLILYNCQDLCKLLGAKL